MKDTYNTFNFWGADNEENGEVEKMEEKKITKEEYNEAVERVIKKQSNDPKMEGAAGIMIGFIDVIFACMVRRELFGESEEE